MQGKPDAAMLRSLLKESFDMLRLIALPAALSLLMSCQMTDTGSTTTTREERLILGQSVIDDCVRSECGRLNLDSQLVENYTQVADLTHVTAFMASYSDFSDLSDIEAMSQLRELHIGQTQVTDLSGLSNFPNLKLLHAQGLFVENYGPIAQLRGLEELALGRGDVGDLAFVRPLRNLTDLNLDGASISSLEGLRGHRSIERLDLGDASLPDDLSVLLSLPKLTELSLSDWSLNDEKRSVISALEARGVTVQYAPAVIVC